MLDTVVITLSEGMFTIMDHDRFEPSARILTEGSGYLGGRGYMTCKQNPTSSELHSGYYKPRLTLTKRILGKGKLGLALKIELSLPKLMFGNNFDELTVSDFDLVAEKLLKVLKEMGVYVFMYVLKNAPISSVHYSKNVPLTDGRTPHYFLNKLSEANTSMLLDVNKSDYRNDGHLYKLHANSFEIAFYDKIRDLEASKVSDKRAVEKDNELQLGLFDDLSKRKFFEVLRVEIRLGKRAKIRQVFKKIGFAVEPTFQNVFRSDISTAVIHHYLEDIQSKRPAILDYKNSGARRFITEVRIANPQTSNAELLKMYGLKQALEEVSLRELREMLGHGRDRGWYRLIEKVNNLKLPQRIDPLTEIIEKIKVYSPLHLVDYKEHLINNDKYQSSI